MTLKLSWLKYRRVSRVVRQRGSAFSKALPGHLANVFKLVIVALASLNSSRSSTTIASKSVKTITL